MGGGQQQPSTEHLQIKKAMWALVGEALAKGIVKPDPGSRAFLLSALIDKVCFVECFSDFLAIRVTWHIRVKSYAMPRESPSPGKLQTPQRNYFSEFCALLVELRVFLCAHLLLLN